MRIDMRDGNSESSLRAVFNSKSFPHSPFNRQTLVRKCDLTLPTGESFHYRIQEVASRLRGQTAFRKVLSGDRSNLEELRCSTERVEHGKLSAKLKGLTFSTHKPRS